MSAAAGASDPPRRPPGGPPNNTPSDETTGSPASNIEEPLVPLPGWVKNTSVKTCACETCGNRVRSWSYQCTGCLRQVCSKCLDPHSNRHIWYKRKARNQLMEGCWHQYRMRGNMHPDFWTTAPPPPKRFKQDNRAHKSKKKAAATSAARKAKAAEEVEANEGAKADGVAKRKHKQQQTWQESAAASSSSVMNGMDDPDDDYPDLAQSKLAVRVADVNSESSTEVDARSATTDLPRDIRPRKLKKLTHPVAYGELDETSESAVDSLSHLVGGSTVIVGAGFIGLFVARELALTMGKTSTDHRITVIDIRPGHCELASGNCNGFLTSKGIPDEWDSLTQVAKEAWLSTISSSDAKLALGFSATTLFDVTETDGANQNISPSWLSCGNNTAFKDDMGALGRVDSSKLASWLYEQCQRLGISFRFNHVISAATFADMSTMVSVHIKSQVTGAKTEEQLRCTNLVLAAGPFTTLIFDQIFPRHSLLLENHAQDAHWFEVETTVHSPGDNVGLHFPHAASKVSYLEDEVAMLFRPMENTVRVSGLDCRIQDQRLESEAAIHPKRGKPRKLRHLSATYLNREGLDVLDQSNIQATGRAQIGVANGGAPIIDAVPSMALGMPKDTSADVGGEQLSGVWLCYGFGRYGTMLAPGAARVLVERLLGAGADEGHFRLAPENVSQPSTGKGRGKAVS